MRTGNGKVTDTAPKRGEGGFALVVVLFVLVVLTSVSIASLLTSSDERKAGRAVRESERAFYAAQAGANAVIANWDNASYDTLMALPGDSLDLGWQALENGSSYRVLLRRVDGGSGEDFYSVTATGRGAGGLRGQRTLGVAMGRDSGNLDIRAAVTLGADHELVSDPTSTIDGNDTNPPGWPSCDAPGPALPGVRMPTAKTPGPGTILGNPPIQVDPTIDPSEFAQFGDLTYSDLVAAADKSYPPSTQPGSFGPVLDGNGDCDTSVQSNWGDPLNPGSPCSDYFPIIHFQGDVEFTTVGSAGQGIMLVDGNLHVGAGDFAFYGLIITQGNCVFEYQSTVHGGVLCKGTGGPGGEIGDAAPINYSSCALQRAWTRSTVALGPVRPLRARAWRQPAH